MKFKNIEIKTVSALLLIFLFSCTSLFPPEDDDVTKGISSLEIGATIELAKKSISSTGGIISVEKNDSPLDGMKIVVPSGAYTTAQTITISASDIKSHEFGEHFNPISPLITIICDGGYSNDFMSLTIPLSIPEGHIPVGFYLDESTGKLEGIPFKEITQQSITLLTRHFLPGSKLRNENSTVKSANTQTAKGANIIISSISESVLNMQPIISSGFKPGTDDWEFINYGSYLCPRGQCAGQNMAAMWYYYEKKNSNGKLFNKFRDNTNIWQSNAVGYRFCSVVQEDMDWDGIVRNFTRNYLMGNHAFDKYQIMTIAASILITREPQYIAVTRPTGTNADGTPRYGGHALICYQVSLHDGKLFISDPNTPGEGQSIIFSNNQFEPYMARLNGHDASNPYPFINYYGKTSLLEWNIMETRWNQVLNNSIGDVAPNTFAEYEAWVVDATDFELTDNLVARNDTLRTKIISPGADLSYNINGERLIGFSVFNEKGERVDIGSNKYNRYVKLKPGQNKLGYYIYGWRTGVVDQSGNYRDKFIDFKWYTIHYIPLRIDPDKGEGEPDKEYKFTARSMGGAPANAKYIWDFGDGSPKITKTGDSTVTHTFTKEGTFNIRLELVAGGDNKTIAQASAVVTITKIGDLVKQLWKTKKMELDASFDFTLASGSNYPQGIQWSKTTGEIIWNNLTFKSEYKNEGSFDSSGNKTNYYRSVGGEVSPDGKKIVSITFEDKKEYYRNNKWHETSSEKITIANIPLTFSPGEVVWGWGAVDHFRYELEGPTARSHITYIQWRWIDATGKDNSLGLNDFKDFWKNYEPVVRFFE
jgi:hypothetical protein